MPDTPTLAQVRQMFPDLPESALMATGNWPVSDTDMAKLEKLKALYDAERAKGANTNPQLLKRINERKSRKNAKKGTNTVETIKKGEAIEKL